MKRDLFISYSQPDKEAASRICAAMESRGVFCWIAPRNIEFGIDWRAAIVGAISNCRALLPIFSKHSNDSPQVRREIERAAHHDKPLFVYRLEPAPFSEAVQFFVSDSQWMDAAEELFDAQMDELVPT